MGRPRKKYKLREVLWADNVRRWYYDGMEALAYGHLAEAESNFQEIIQHNPDFPGGYEGLAAVETERNDKVGARKFVDFGFDKVKTEYPRWPKRLPWSILENRPILRIIQMKAIHYHEDGNHKEAEKLYRLLLLLNPGDNQGIRYLLSGLKRGITPEEVDEGK